MRHALPVALTLLAAGALAIAPRPAADNSVHALLESDDEGATDYRRFEELFGTDEVVVARVEHPDLQVVLQTAARLTELLERDPTIDGVVSVGTAYAAELDLLLDEDLGGLGELPRLRPRFSGPLNRALRLFEPEEKRATIYGLGRVVVPSERAPLVAQLEAEKARLEREGGRLRLAGPPLLNLELDREAENVERTALPALVLVAIIFLLITTKSPLLTAALLAPVGLGVFAAEGALGLLGLTRNIIVDIAKPLIFVLILASGIHVLVGFQEARRRGLDAPESSSIAQKTKAIGVILALLTTAIGFGSLIFSPNAPIVRFGLVSAFGVLAGAPLTLILLPALFRFALRPPREPFGWLDRAPARCIAFATRHPIALPLIAMVVTVGGFAIVPQLRTDPHAIRYFAADHPLRKDHEALESSGLGLFSLELVVTSTSSLQSRAAVLRLDELARRVGSREGVRAVIGLPLFLREANFRAAGIETIPEQPIIDAACAEQMQLADFITADRKTARLAAMIETLDADRVDDLSAAIREDFGDVFESGELTVTGNYRLLIHAQRSLIETLQLSLLSTAVLMELIFLIALRSFVMALVVLLPNVFPIGLNFLLMYVTGIPLDLGTTMTAAIALGIAVDNTVHFSLGWKRGGIELATKETGRAMMMAALVITAGFLALTTSTFGPTRNFGILAGMAMVSALAGDLLVLPPLLEWIGRSKKS